MRDRHYSTVIAGAVPESCITGGLEPYGPSGLYILHGAIKQS